MSDRERSKSYFVRLCLCGSLAKMKGTDKNEKYGEEGVLNALGVFLLFAPMAMFWGDKAIEPEIDRDVSFGLAIEDHRLARSHVGCLHDGKTVFRRMSSLAAETNDGPVAVWFKKDELASLDNPTLWQKVRNCCRSFASRFWLDEHGAYVFMKDSASEVLPKGCYVHLGSVRVEIDMKVAGTYIYEFPFYMDNTIIGSDRAELIAGFRNKVLSDVCKTVHRMVSPEESYRVTEVLNGVVLTERLARFSFKVLENGIDSRGA